MNPLMIKYGIDIGTLSKIFRSHLENEGIVFDRESDFQLERSSKRIYLRTNHHNDATKNKKKTAWYLVDLDNARMSYGWFHAGGANFTYSLYEYIQEMDLQPGDTVYTKEQQEEDLKRFLNSCKSAEKNKKDQEILAQIYMGFEWARSLPLSNRPHNYNVKKQISFSHARLYNPSNFTKNELIDYVSQYYPQHKNNTIILNRIIDLQPDLDQQSLRQNKLLVEGQNLKNQIIFLQTIAEHKNKRGEDKFTLRGVLANGAFKILYKDPLDAWNQDRIIFCEGYATGEAIAESIQYSIPVIVVYVAGNIMNVVRDFRAEFPFSRFYIFNDNDHKTALESKIKRNPGIYYATEACRAVNAAMIGPEFTEEQLDLSDWNDFKCLYGVDYTRDVIRHKMQNAVWTTAVQSTVNPNYSISALFFGIKQQLDDIGLYPDSMTKKNWFSLVLRAYALLTQQGFSQIHPIELVKEQFIEILGQISKQPRKVTGAEEPELLQAYTKLVEMIARNDSTTALNQQIITVINLYKNADYPIETLKVWLKDILSKSNDPEWSENFINNIFISII